jgi:RecB family exonuclease
VPSFAAGLRTGTPATEQEARLAVVLAGQPLVTDIALERGRRAVLARAARAFGPYDGNLTGVAVTSPAAAGQAVSATRLEAWAACPYGYFVRYLLRVEPVENPEALLQLSPLEQGTLVHRALEGYVAERIRSGTPAGSVDQDLLHRHFELACRDAEGRGVTGRPLLWQHQRDGLWQNLLDFTLEDAERSAGELARPLAAEHSFGFATEPLAVSLGAERSLRFRGSIDRVDRAGNGQLIVTDYKHSSDFKYRDLRPENPTVNGTVLQLPIYALAAKAAYDDGRLPLPVTARYSFVKPRNGKLPAPKGLEVDAAVLQAWEEALEVIVDGIEHGHFPARPGDDNTRYAGFISCSACDPDGLGTAETQRRWEHLRRAPELAGYVRLLGLAVADDEEEEVGGDA